MGQRKYVIQGMIIVMGLWIMKGRLIVRLSILMVMVMDMEIHLRIQNAFVVLKVFMLR